MAKNKKRKPVNENLAAYLFLAPWLIGFIFLNWLPNYQYHLFVIL